MRMIIGPVSNPILGKGGHRKTKVLAFVEYFNQTMAKPFKWTYKGKALAA